jgi:nitroreductase
MMGIDACPMEGIVRDKVDELLGLSGGEYTSTVACALGYRSSQDKYAAARKVRYSSSDVVQYI